MLFSHSPLSMIAYQKHLHVVLVPLPHQIPGLLQSIKNSNTSFIILLLISSMPRDVSDEPLPPLVGCPEPVRNSNFVLLTKQTTIYCENNAKVKCSAVLHSYKRYQYLLCTCILMLLVVFRPNKSVVHYNSFLLHLRKVTNFPW